MLNRSLEAGRLIGVSMVCSLPGFYFVLVGTFGAAWVEVEVEVEMMNQSTEIKLQEGIWLATLCRNNTGQWDCQTSIRKHILADPDLQLSAPTLDESDWLDFQKLSVLSIAGSVLTVMTTTLVLGRKWKSRVWMVLLSVGAVCSVATSIFMMIPTIKIATVSLRHEAINTSWTFVLGALGSVFHFIAPIILTFAVYRRWRRHCHQEEQRTTHHRHLETAVQYLVSNTDTENENGSWTFNPGSRFSTEKVRMSGSDSCVGTSSSPPLYAGREALHEYSEITMR